MSRGWERGGERGVEWGWERWSWEEIETTDHLFCMFGEQIPKSYSGFRLFTFQCCLRDSEFCSATWRRYDTSYIDSNVDINKCWKFSLLENLSLPRLIRVFFRLDRSFNFMHRRLQFQSRSGLGPGGPCSKNMSSINFNGFWNVFEKSFELLLALNFRLKVLVGQGFSERKKINELLKFWVKKNLVFNQSWRWLVWKDSFRDRP